MENKTAFRVGDKVYLLLEEIKNNYQKELAPEFKDWDSYISDQPFYKREDIYDEIAFRFAKAVAEKSLQNAAEAHLEIQPEYTHRDVIENPKNIAF